MIIYRIDLNDGLYKCLFSFSGWGEKLLERNKHPGHNLRQYRNYDHHLFNCYLHLKRSGYGFTEDIGDKGVMHPQLYNNTLADLLLEISSA